MDSIFFNKEIISLLAKNSVNFTVSVPFVRFREPKKTIKDCPSWHEIDDKWSYFETQWKPKSWNTEFRFVFTRQKGPLQLDLFVPLDSNYESTTIMAHNFSREMQMLAHPAASRAKPKRPAAWKFKKLGSFAARLSKEQVV